MDEIGDAREQRHRIIAAEKALRQRAITQGDSGFATAAFCQCQRPGDRTGGRRRQSRFGRVAILAQRGLQNGGLLQPLRTDRSVALEVVDALVDPFEHGHDGIDLHGVQTRRSGTHPAQIVLGLVQRRVQRRQVEQARRALEGVHRAESTVEALRIARRGLQREQIVDGRLHQFARLDDELGHQLVHQSASGR